MTASLRRSLPLGETSSTSDKLHYHRHLPHRGEHFSVDDDTSEVEQDRARRTSCDLRHGFAARQGSFRGRKTHHQRQSFSKANTISADQTDDDYRANMTVWKSGAKKSSSSSVSDGPVSSSLLDQEDQLSEVESFTLEDRQQAINETHPFGVRIWQSALYKKDVASEPSVEQTIDSLPSQIVSTWLWGFNLLWTILFGWWLALFVGFGALVWLQIVRDSSSLDYLVVLRDLAWYLFWPFGKVVHLRQDNKYADEDEGDGRSFHEYRRWERGLLEYGRLMFGHKLPHSDVLNEGQAGHQDTLRGDDHYPPHQRQAESPQQRNRRLFGRGPWTWGRFAFFLYFYCCIGPLLLLVSLICWLMVFWIPMSRILLILFYNLRQRPLALSFEKPTPQPGNQAEISSVLVCTYRAVGPSYWRYRVSGTNILLFNSVGIVVFLILDFLALKKVFELDCLLTNPKVLFCLGLVSLAPLTYFVGEAVASISTQSSMGTAATLNAFFSTVIEVTLYCFALQKGDDVLVEGSLIGSVLGGILLMPGLSMCFGALKRKTQRFNVQSTYATNTMLLFATITAFGPTMLYKLMGSYDLTCSPCPEEGITHAHCQQCYFRQGSADDGELFRNVVQPYTWLAATLLFSSYVIGLLFTLRTHAAIIWTTDGDDKKAPDTVADSTESSHLERRHQNHKSSRRPGKHALPNIHNSHTVSENDPSLRPTPNSDRHSSPIWSLKKSASILIVATVAYVIIAEILVDTVDAILVSTNVDEKFLGLTLFALLPNTSEFVNAISFALNENIALSMEIGSAYGLQVFLLQIPALVLFSTLCTTWDGGESGDNRQPPFRLVFPLWDVVSVFLCVMLLGYVSGEGKSNYFKGSILLLAYFIVLAGSFVGRLT